MINAKSLVEQLRSVSAAEDLENRPQITGDLLQLHEKYSEKFFRDIRPILIDEEYPVVAPLGLPADRTQWVDNMPIVGVDGSSFIATPPNFKTSFIITNTAVFAYFPQTNTYDFRVYTKVYLLGDTESDLIKELSTLYMLADEADGAAQYVKKDLQAPAMVLFDGMTFAALDSYGMRQMIGVNNIKNLENHPSALIYRNAMDMLTKSGSLVTVVSSNPRTTYISPVVQYNACPYRDNPTLPMNCQICATRHGGYQYDCEPYSIVDASYFRHVITDNVDETGQKKLFVSAPIKSKEGKVSNYIVSTQYGWTLRADTDESLYETNRKEFRKLLRGIGMQMYIGVGYPYVLHQAHHISTINGEVREQIDSVAAMCGLYVPTPKSIGKISFSPNDAPKSVLMGSRMKE